MLKFEIWKILGTQILGREYFRQSKIVHGLKVIDVDNFRHLKL